MTLDADHAALGGEGHEVSLEILVLVVHHEADVHAAAVLLVGHGGTEELVALDLAVEQVGLLDGATLHLLDAALSLDPLEVLQSAVDGHCGRCVEHRAVLHVGAVVEHRGDGAAHLAQTFVLDDDEGHTGHGEVLLSAAVDHGILRHVHGTGEDVARHVGDQGHGRVDVLEDLGAVDGVVAGDVEVVGVSRNGPSLGDVGVSGVGAGSHLDGLAEVLGLGHSLLGPYAGVQIGSLLLEEVVGHHAELQRGTAAEEDHTVTLGDVEQLLEQGYCFVHYGLEVLGTMAHFHQREAGALKFDAGICNGLHHLCGQFGRTGVEIVLFHFDFTTHFCAFSAQTRALQASVRIHYLEFRPQRYTLFTT